MYPFDLTFVSKSVLGTRFKGKAFSWQTAGPYKLHKWSLKKKNYQKMSGNVFHWGNFFKCAITYATAIFSYNKVKSFAIFVLQKIFMMYFSSNCDKIFCRCNKQCNCLATYQPIKVFEVALTIKYCDPLFPEMISTPAMRFSMTLSLISTMISSISASFFLSMPRRLTRNLIVEPFRVK